MYPLRRQLRLRHGRWQRCPLLVHQLAAGGADAIADTRAAWWAAACARLLVSRLSAPAYRASN